MSQERSQFAYLLENDDIRKAHRVEDLGMSPDGQYAIIFSIETEKTHVTFLEAREDGDESRGRWHFELTDSGALMVKFRLAGQADSSEFAVAYGAGVWRSVERGGIEIVGPDFD